MMIYFSLLLVPPVMLLLFNKNEKKEEIALAVTCVYAFLILAFRSRFSGVDMAAFSSSYDTLKNYTFMQVLKDCRFPRKGTLIPFEWGYTLICWAMCKCGLDYQVFLVLQSAFCIYSLYHFINKYSEKPSLSIVIAFGLGIFDYLYCIIRQAIAFAILLYTVDFIKNRKYYIAVLLVLVATLFHQSALIFIVAIPFCFLPINWVTSLVFIGLSILIVPLFPTVIDNLTKIFFSKLFNSGYRSGTFEFGELVYGIIAMDLFMTFFYTKKKEELTSTDRFIYWTAMLTLPIQFISMYFSILARVGTLTFMPFNSVAVTNAFLKKGEKEDKIKIFLVVAIYLVMCAYYLFCLYYDKRGLWLIPYKTFFTD